MKSLGTCLGSAARTDILRVLASQYEPIGVRYLARLADVCLNSAEVSLASLCSEALVERLERSGRPLYQLNRAHEDVPILVAIFDAAACSITQARCAALATRARSILPFIREASGMIKHAKTASKGSVHEA